MVINTVLQKEYLRDYILILIPFLKEEVERLVLYIDDKNDDVKLTNLGKNLNTTVLEYEYNSRKICASQMKRTHNFFSAAHFAMPLPTVNYSLLTINCTHTFSAKEKDTETGLSYFGARYYSSDLSIWLSVDPMSDKYPSLSPYAYCANNPVKFNDPDGRWIPGLDDNGNVTYTAEKGDNYDTFVKQFDCRNAKGEHKGKEIFSNAKMKSDGSGIKEGSVIYGDAVTKATGSDILKGNWHNMSNKQKAAQLMFAIKYSSCHGDWSFDLKDFAMGFQTGGEGFNFSASNIPDGNGGFIQIQNISVGCTYENTVMTSNLFWNEDNRANREMYSTHNIYKNSPGQRPMIMFTLDKTYTETFEKMVKCR
jgi:RHS repeat-associated protein